MSFHEIRLDHCYSHGATGGPKFNTTILTLSSGNEKRNINWSQIRGEWSIQYNGKRQEDIDTLKAFFYARQGKAYGFRFKDWADFNLSRQQIGLTDTATSEFQIYKRYTSGSVNFDRPLTKIVSNSDAVTDLTVWVDNTERSEGAGGTQYQIDRDTGIITLGATLTALSGKAIEVECEFDVPVRFDTDQFQSTIVTGDPDNRLYAWGSLPIVEIRDIE